MSKGKPCEHDMPLTERQQMNLNSEGATHVRMEAQSRLSQKYVLLQVWCGLLTVGLVVMAALLTSIKPKSTEAIVASQRSDYATPAVQTSMTPPKSPGSPPSFIQLIKSSDGSSWQVEHKSEPCSLDLHDNSIKCTQTSWYFLYAQVTFSKVTKKKNQTKSVILKRNPSPWKSLDILVRGTFPPSTECSVWVAKIVSLEEGDSVSLEITDDFLSENTFWGAYQLH